MQRVRARRFEYAVDVAAATLFAAAAAHLLVNAATGAVLAASLAALAFAGSFKGLRAVEARRARAAIAAIDIRSLFDDMKARADEPVLTDGDRIEKPPLRLPADKGLLLDDILEQLRPDARVVRLFDRSEMPTPGRLQARLDRHLELDSPQSAPPDASQDLYQALADLRRSLR